MLKKLQLKSWLLMLCMLVGVGNAWGAEVTSAVTLSNGQYETDHITWTVDGITIQQLKGTSTNAVNSNYVASPRVYKGHILSFSANSGYAIKSISITYTGTYSGNSMTAGTELNGTTVTDNTTDVSRTWATVNDGTHVVSSVSEDGLSQIYIQNVASATNTQLRPTAISITYIAADDAKKIATVTIGESTLLVGATTTITTDGPEVTLTTSDASIASVSGSTITAEAAGAATITATWDENNEYEAGTKTFDVRVVEVTDGEFDFTTGYAYGSGLKQSVNQVTTTKTFTAGNITLTTSGNFAWNTDGTLRIYSGALYALAAPEGYIITKIAFTGTQNLTSVTVDSGSLSGNGTAATWTGRAQSVIITRDDANPFYNTITVTYEAQGDKEEAGLIYAPTSYTATIGGENTFPTLSNPNELDVTYESSNTGVATIDANGVVTLVAAGTTTITASSEEDETYNAGSSSYTLTVVDPNAPGTENNPYTVAQARAAIDAGTGVTGVYATGIVSEIVTAYNAQYGNITYNISADGSTTSDQLQAYRGKNYNGDNFTSEDDIQVGDVVVVYGNLKKYNDTYEFDSGNQLVSLTRPVSTDPVINATDVTIAYNATSGSIEYTIENVVEGTILTATSEAEWISGITVGESAVSFTTTANESDADRTATITLAYEGAVDKTVTVTQGHYIVDYATLPFAFDGGKAAIENTNGLTQNGLGSDYNNSPKLKFDSTGDELVLKFNKRPGTLTFDIQGNGFSGGTFKVQTSEDGETYTDLKTYTELASSSSESFDDIDKNVRYIKWVYTEKVSGNVALGNIILDRKILKGDVNEDGEVTIADVTTLVNIILGKDQ